MDDLPSSTSFYFCHDQLGCQQAGKRPGWGKNLLINSKRGCGCRYGKVSLDLPISKCFPEKVSSNIKLRGAWQSRMMWNSQWFSVRGTSSSGPLLFQKQMESTLCKTFSGLPHVTDCIGAKEWAIRLTFRSPN